jgi:hypothetical protein
MNKKNETTLIPLKKQNKTKKTLSSPFLSSSLPLIFSCFRLLDCSDVWILSSESLFLSLSRL